MGGYRYAVIAWAAFGVIAAALGLSALLRPLATPPTLDERVMAIAADVRCPECVGESAADSDTQASLAIRAEIARDLQAGLTTPQILDRLASEYGQWILYRPPVRGAFLLLWGAPVLALAGTGWALRSVLVSPAARAAGVPAAAGPPAPGERPPRDASGREPEPDPEILRQLARRL